MQHNMQLVVCMETAYVHVSVLTGPIVAWVGISLCEIDQSGSHTSAVWPVRQTRRTKPIVAPEG